MNLLYLSHRIPYPPNKGDKIRSFNQVKYLAGAGHKVHLVCLADQTGDTVYKENLLAWCKSVYLEYRSKDRAKVCSLPWLLSSLPLSVPCFYSSGLQKEVDRLLQEEDIEAVVCFSSVMGEYIVRSSIPNLDDLILIMDFCDLDSDKWLQYSTGTLPPMSWIYAREGRLLLDYEKRLEAYFDYFLFVTRAEADLFISRGGSGERIRILANGVDHDFFTPAGEDTGHDSTGEKGPVLMFSGAMDYHANVDGIRWFCKDVWPGLSGKVSDLRLHIVGANPVAAVRGLAGENVEVTGYANDIREYYRKSDICIIPLRLARGVQNKVLEAMAMGRPVVTTSRVLQGIPATPEQDLLTADTAREFERQVLRLLNDSELARTIGNQGRKFVLRHYDWQQNLQGLDSLLQDKPGKKSGNPGWRRGRFNPVYFLVFILVLFFVSLWPMEVTSP
ncbi:MAG: TIGR03087 family PEP-CTERM/XrtA system glycosyltransferase, partial [Desulfobia sp.]